jgi:uncharacterized protein YegL
VLLYVLVDTSGSTIRGQVNAGVNMALPQFVACVEERFGSAGRFCLTSYGTDAVMRVPLARAADISFLPQLAADGLSSLAAGLTAVARAVAADRGQLLADGEDVPTPAVVVVADGLPTDAGDVLMDARDSLDEAGVREVDLVVPDSVDTLAVAGLRVRRHTLTTGDPAGACGSMVAAVRRALAS